MKKHLAILFCCLSAAVLVGCDPDGPSNKTGAVTGAATHISCRSAEIAGKANLPGTTATDLTFGVLYSTNSGVLVGSATQIQAKSFDSDYNFTVNTEVLEPETTYYYRSYISQNNEITYGDTKSFKTLAVSSMIKTEDATEIDAGVATLNATLDLTDCKYDAIEYGFKLTPKDGTEGSYKASDLSNKAYSYKVETLVRDKQYDVAAYVTLDGRTYTAESKSFTTQSLKASVTLNEATNITEFAGLVSGKMTIESQGQFPKVAKLYYSDTEGTAEELKANGIAKSLTPYPDGTLSFYIQGLEPDKTCYYAMIVTIDGVDFASEVKSFKTADFTAAVTTQDATNIEYSTVTLNGTLSVTSIEVLTKEVWFLYSETATTVDALKSGGTKLASTLSGNSFSASLSGLKHETTYYYVACAKVQNRVVYGATVKTLTTKALPAGAVDMGLSVLWHQCNIGASKPEEYGDYFAWGETKTKSTYNWSTYTLCQGSNTTMTKYCTSSSYGTVDNKTVLDKADDVAAQKLGGNWRMPTDAEWTELRNTDNCTWTWTTENSVNGYRVTSKKTGNSIFLPAAGYRREDGLINAGSNGVYWSSSLNVGSSTYAWRVYFGSSHVSGYDYFRYNGQSVRPVSE